MGLTNCSTPCLKIQWREISYVPVLMKLGNQSWSSIKSTLLNRVMINYPDHYIMDVKSKCRKLEDMAWPRDKEGIVKENSDFDGEGRNSVSGSNLNESPEGRRGW